MQYDLSNELQIESFVARANKLVEKGVIVELTEKTFRSKQQNSYLHLLIGLVAMETGNTMRYCKDWYYKRLCNEDIFVTTKQDKYAGDVVVLRSSADLTKEEMSMSIDRFKRWGNEQGIYMPNPEDEGMLRQIAIELGRMKQYIGE